MFLMLQHIHYQDTVWRREEGRNVPDAAAHTLPGHCVEERGMNVPGAAAHTLLGHCVEEGGRKECS
jgi:hypothetical protein